jgi:hypothetical protein
MSTILNKNAFEYAKELIEKGKYVSDEKDAWSEHEPSSEMENKFIEEHGFKEYSKWYLGIDDTEEEGKKKRYKFPYGDFQKVHRCGVLSAETRAGQYKYSDIERAAADLHGMIDARKGRLSRTKER